MFFDWVHETEYVPVSDKAADGIHVITGTTNINVNIYSVCHRTPVIAVPITYLSPCLQLCSSPAAAAHLLPPTAPQFWHRYRCAISSVTHGSGKRTMPPSTPPSSSSLPPTSLNCASWRAGSTRRTTAAVSVCGRVWACVMLQPVLCGTIRILSCLGQYVVLCTYLFTSFQADDSCCQMHVGLTGISIL